MKYFEEKKPFSNINKDSKLDYRYSSIPEPGEAVDTNESSVLEMKLLESPNMNKTRQSSILDFQQKPSETNQSKIIMSI